MLEIGDEMQKVVDAKKELGGWIRACIVWNSCLPLDLRAIINFWLNKLSRNSCLGAVGQMLDRP